MKSTYKTNVQDLPTYIYIREASYNEKVCVSMFVKHMSIYIHIPSHLESPSTYITTLHQQPDRKSWTILGTNTSMQIKKKLY